MSQSDQTRPNVTVRLSAADQSAGDLLQIFEALLPVTFERVIRTAEADEIGIVFEAPRPSSSKNGAERLRLTLPSAVNQPAVSMTEAQITFADFPETPFPFRGRTLKVRIPSETPSLSSIAGETILATGPSGPVWAVSTSAAVRHVRSSHPLPMIAADGMLQQVLNADRFLELLPLLEFLREVCANEMYSPPPLRACFMFDDPNLHWPRYGFVDYKDIAARAARENYHVSFATVPLDGWFTHSGAARLFQDNPKQLSLLVHGNDHTHHELAQDYSSVQRPALLRQAIRRIEQLERASGCRVSRVMAAPHGACSEAMLSEMTAAGFESAAISHGSLQAHNKGKPWTRNLGYLASEVIRGCPVLPRWGMTGNTLNTILLAAYLRQPIILRGHHADLRRGAELLDDLARVINGLGEVCWGDMSALSRRNYQTCCRDGTLHVCPGGVYLDVTVSEGTTRLVIPPGASDEWTDWLCYGNNLPAKQFKSGKPVELPDGCRRVILKAIVAPSLNAQAGPNGLPVWPFIRRLLTEGRDRLQAISR